MSKMPQIIKNIFLGIGIGIYILSLLHYPVYSNTLLQLQEEITKKEKEIAEKESVLEGVERRIKEISSSNYSLSQKINLLNEEIQTLEKNIEETEGEIEEKVKGIEEKYTSQPSIVLCAKAGVLPIYPNIFPSLGTNSLFNLLSLSLLSTE